jgi:hypothetical protein
MQRKQYLDFGGSDEALHPFMEKEIPDGPTKGNRLSGEDFDVARKHYYKHMGMGCRGQARS